MTPRILTLTGTTHPKAEINAISPENGYASFRWLNAAGNPVDSGGSIARFTPLDPLPTDPENPLSPVVYPEIADEVLIDAIENPPIEAAPTVILTPLTVISRLTPEEQVAIFTSADPEICVWRNMACAAQEIRTDDPRTALGFALLVSKGILTADRPAALMAPG